MSVSAQVCRIPEVLPVEKGSGCIICGSGWVVPHPEHGSFLCSEHLYGPRDRRELPVVLVRRPPIADLVTEERLLGCALVEPRTVDHVAGVLVQSDFFDELHSLLWRACREAWRRAPGHYFTGAVQQWLPKTKKHVDWTPIVREALYSGFDLRRVCEYAGSVADAARRRRRVEAAVKAIEAAYTQD